MKFSIRDLLLVTVIVALVATNSRSAMLALSQPQLQTQ